MADILVAPDGSILEICECGDETCIEWPVGPDGLYISNEEMDKYFANRVKLVALCTRILEQRKAEL